jgi:ADP-heptose:LPS heptosyltransferase
MGLGGYLTWTAAAREINQRSGTKVLPFEQHGNALKLIKSPIFSNNPYISQEFTGEFLIPMQLNNPASNYCKKDMPDRCVQRGDKHIIEQICEVYGIEDPRLKCDIFLTEKETRFIDDLLESAVGNSSFVTIEPHSNCEYTVNRSYPFEKWQQIVNELCKKICVVQVGEAGVRSLSGVVDMSGKTSFRQASGIIGRSNLFLSSEGGLVHAATSHETTSLVIMTDYEAEAMVAYPQNINIHVGRGHGPCGMKIKCIECEKDVSLHDHNEIIDKTMYFLEST